MDRAIAHADQMIWHESHNMIGPIAAHTTLVRNPGHRLLCTPRCGGVPHNCVSYDRQQGKQTAELEYGMAEHRPKLHIAQPERFGGY